MLGFMLGSLLIAEDASACSCAPCQEFLGDGTLLDSDEIHIVFAGRVKSMRIVTEQPDLFDRILESGSWIFSDTIQKEIEFDQLEIVKGPKVGVHRVRTPLHGATCGAGFFLGGTQRVAGRVLPNGVVETDFCTQLCWANETHDDVFEAKTDDMRYPGINTRH